jgi:prepilin-type N-terminal cleavage/methylation domain-containing protein
MPHRFTGRPSRRCARARGFTLIELIVVISIIALLVSLLLPALQKGQRAAQQIKSSTQLRSIQQALVIYAQDNEGYYAGIHPDGISSDGRAAFWDAANTPTPGVPTIETVATSGRFCGASVEGRFAILLEGGYLSPGAIVSPAEDRAFQPEAGVGTQAEYRGDPSDPMQPNEYFWSYGLLKIRNTWNVGSEGSLSPWWLKGWSDQTSSQSVVAADRLLFRDGNVVAPDHQTHASLWSVPANGWKGGIVFNDGHTTFSNSSQVEDTKYGNGPVFPKDNIFTDIAWNDDRIPSESKWQIKNTRVVANNFNGIFHP